MRPFPRSKGLVVPVVISGVTALAAIRPLSPVRDALTLGPLSHMRLAVGPSYVLFSPVYNALDALSLLTAAQHVTVVAVAAAGFAVWRSAAAARNATTVRRELRVTAVALALLLGCYLVATLAPRPMAALVVDDPDAVVVDFHSHTDASHDGRRGFSAERNREWHRSAGFDVAYVSDHGTYAAAMQALRRNPALAGDGTVLLPALETRYSGQHLNILGFAAESVYGSLPPERLASFSGSVPPPGMLTIPALLEHAGRESRIVAVELIDGSPRGLQFGEQRRAELVRLAAQLGAPMVAGSNNHGWGRAAPCWTVVRIPGWRRLTPVALDSAILATLASKERGRVIVVERLAPAPARESMRMANVAAVMRNPFRMLTSAEQIAWIAWTWLLWWITALARRRHKRSRRGLLEQP